MFYLLILRKTTFWEQIFHIILDFIRFLILTDFLLFVAPLNLTLPVLRSAAQYKPPAAQHRAAAIPETTTKRRSTSFVFFSPKKWKKVDPDRQVHERFQEICHKILQWNLKAVSSDLFPCRHNFWRLNFDWVSGTNILFQVNFELFLFLGVSMADFSFKKKDLWSGI